MSPNQRLILSTELLLRIHRHGEKAYPEEGAGILLGRTLKKEERLVLDLLGVENAREDGSRHNRYLITPYDMLRAEMEAEQRGLEIIGIFHSHPDHPNRPSEIDLEWALPWLSYLITSVLAGKATESRSWQLRHDREQFDEEELVIISEKTGIIP